jgi:hypothetical protein
MINSDVFKNLLIDIVNSKVELMLRRTEGTFVYACAKNASVEST